MHENGSRSWIKTIQNAKNYTDKQLYVSNQTGHQSTGKFDKVVVSGNQRWAFNYLTGTETFTYVSGVKTTVNVWEKTGLIYSQIVSQVENFINQTKV